MGRYALAFGASVRREEGPPKFTALGESASLPPNASHLERVGATLHLARSASQIKRAASAAALHMKGRYNRPSGCKVARPPAGWWQTSCRCAGRAPDRI
jgi:hypothetical protein